MSRTPAPLYREIVSLLLAIDNCRESGNSEWEEKHEDSLSKLESYLPSGSGIDCGTKIDREKTKRNKLVLSFSFHHMNDNGFYDGWTDHEVIITPDLCFGLDIRITGKNKRDVKDYLHEVYSVALTTEVVQDENCQWHLLPV